MDDREKIAESVRSGAYFTQARAWYEAMYLSPVSGRTMFLLIALFAAVVAGIALLSLSTLLPITSRQPVLVAMTDKMLDYTPQVYKLNPEGKDVNEALVDYFVLQYVASTETWNAKEVSKNDGYVRSHSTKDVYVGYVRRMGAEGISGALGDVGTREIVIDRVDVTYGPTGGEAQIGFTAQTGGGDVPSAKSQWTAKLKYQYTPMKVEEAKGEKPSASALLVTDPQFQVTEYAVEPLR